MCGRNNFSRRAVWSERLNDGSGAKPVVAREVTPEASPLTPFLRGRRRPSGARRRVTHLAAGVSYNEGIFDGQ
jgi:hypothetical protein